MTKSNPMQTFLWLLKREYWENRGGFLRAPLITAGVMIAITLLTLMIAESAASRHGINLGGMNLDAISRNMTTDQIALFNSGLNAGLMVISVPIMVALFFVVFFYLLGALYDDRRDRSVLFWKSLPVSDLHTVLSKAAAAAVIAPLFAIAAVIVLHLAFLLIISAYAMLKGVNPLPLLWNPRLLVSLWARLILLIPINALWALPTVGWLLLCSSFVRSKPFLWAVLLPLITGILIGMVGLMQQLSLPSMWYWRNIVGRILLGFLPGSWLGAFGGSIFGIFKSGDNIDIALAKGDIVSAVLSWDHIVGILGSLDLWLGVVAGIGMIAAAVYFRRQRIETSV
ncbi:hypothetical protein [Rudaea sp.]|uniref:hypothetical protein n=1 Tax=Rudaea sp. TaxID=2136325 RepID=UPI002ED09987